MGVSQNDELNTWAEIAEHLGVSARTAQDYERFQGMPVYRLGGKKPRVWAYRTEIEAWRRALGRAEAVAGPVEEPRARDDAPDRRAGWRWWWTATLVGAVILAGVAASVWRVRGNPTHFRVSGNDLVALDVHDGELWRHTFSRPISNPEENPRTRGWWCGTPGDGGGIFCAVRIAPVHWESTGIWVCGFRADGKRLWQFVPGREVTDESGSHMFPPYSAVTILAVRNGSGGVRFVVPSFHYMEQACQVAILDETGAVVAEYWHPGHLYYGVQLDVDGDGRNEVLLGGVNNGDHQATVVVLDPWDMHGLSTPSLMKDTRFRLLGMPEAKEKGVILFPLSCASTGKPYNRVRNLWVTRERLVVEVAEGVDETRDPSLVYEFDHHLNPVSCTVGGIRNKAVHDELQARGILHHPFNEREVMELKDRVEVRRSW